MISDGLWRRDFSADPDIVGKTIEINNNVLTVVGVADPTFHGTIVSYDVELFIPVMMAPQLGFTFGSQQTTPSGILSDRRAGVFYPHGYLRPGTTLASATAQADALWATLSRERPLTDAAQRLKVVRFWQTPGSGPTFMLPTLTVLSPMGLLVLMIACANIAGLVLVRGRVATRRNRACVWRSARRGRGSSGCWLSKTSCSRVPGAVFGVLLARNAIPVLVSYAERLAAPQRIFFNIEVDGLVIGFTALVACGSALVFGFVPALQSSRVDLVSVINEDASPRGAARGRLRAGLVVAQVAVSLLLLVGAGLATRSVDAAPARESRLRPEPGDGDRAGRQTERLRRAARARLLSQTARRRACRSRHRISDPRGVHSDGAARYARAARLDRGLRTAPGRRSGVHVEHDRFGLLPHASDQPHGRSRVRRQRR